MDRRSEIAKSYAALGVPTVSDSSYELLSHGLEHRLSDEEIEENDKRIAEACRRFRELREREPKPVEATTPELYPSIRGRAGVRFY